jgi:membrane protease subunit HflC
MPKRNNLLLVAVVALLAVVAARASLFTVDQTQRALVLQFGEPVGEIREPGLHAKIPFIQMVVAIDSRLMEYDVAAAEIYTRDNKNMVVDAYARGKVVDPLVFYQRFKSENSYSIIEEAKRRLGVIVIGELRRELGLHVMADIISQNRGSIMETVTDSSNRKLAEDTRAGLVVVDVRIKRADLPPENQKAVYDRMRAEREQQATKYRSEGRRDGQKIMAETDQAVRETLANAARQNQIIRGEADSEAAVIYSAAYGQDPEFYAFKRSLDSYHANLGERSVILLDTSNDYLRYFGSPEARSVLMATKPQPAPAGDSPAAQPANPESKPPAPAASLEGEPARLAAAPAPAPAAD